VANEGGRSRQKNLSLYHDMPHLRAALSPKGRQRLQQV
jgi:hypothetical protein